jgi:cell division protein FtsZ
MVTSPFSFEGKKRLESAEAGIEEFRKHVDSLIIIPNDRLLQVAPQKSTSTEALKKADEILYFAVKGISDLLLRPSLVTLDIHDVRSVMSFSGCLAVMGTGFASGESRAREAAIKAVANAELLLPEGVPFGGARRVLMNITCGPDLGIDEVAEAASIVAEATHEDSQLIFAPLCDENIGDAIRITFIATGFD